MSNIIDYIIWRGDLSFNQSKINELDNIIFARFSYLPFKNIKIEKTETIESIAKKMKELNIEEFLWEDDKDFIYYLGKSNRFKNLEISDYVEVIDNSAEKQFAAVCISISNKLKYISFRGTDSSLV